MKRAQIDDTRRITSIGEDGSDACSLHWKMVLSSLEVLALLSRSVCSSWRDPLLGEEGSFLPGALASSRTAQAQVQGTLTLPLDR